MPKKTIKEIRCRANVYRAIDGERDYQEMVERNPKRCRVKPEHSVGEYIVMLDYYQRELHEAWCKTPGDEAALHTIRKIAAICVKCMEHHGAPKRSME